MNEWMTITELEKEMARRNEARFNEFVRRNNITSPDQLEFSHKIEITETNDGTITYKAICDVTIKES